MSRALLKLSPLLAGLYRGVNTFRIVKTKDFKIGWRRHSSKVLHEAQQDTHESDNGHWTFNTAGSAQLEFSSPRVTKYILGPTSPSSILN